MNTAYQVLSGTSTSNIALSSYSSPFLVVTSSYCVSESVSDIFFENSARPFPAALLLRSCLLAHSGSLLQPLVKQP